jgi:hypothetical protein
MLMPFFLCKGMHARLPNSIQICIYFLLTFSASPAAIWDEAPDYDGWRHLDWFGFMYPMEGYILHAEHGWQYPAGNDPASFHLYDLSIKAWAWIGRDTYPWIYWYGNISEWLFYYTGGSSGNRWFYNEQRDLFQHESDLYPAVFESGPFTNHTVTAGSVESLVKDPPTGLAFGVPAGESGSVRVATLETAPPAPYPGEGYTIETQGLASLELILSKEELVSGEFPIVYVYGRMQGAFDDDTGYRERWIGLPYEEDQEGNFYFSLPDTTPEVSIGTMSAEASPRASGGSRPSHYFVSRISPDMPELDNRLNVELQVTSYVADFANALSPALRGTFDTRKDRRPLRISYGANYYTGFNKLRVGSYGRTFTPFMQISSPLQTNALAHETGHYLTHLVVGDAVYDSLEAAGGSIFSGNHGIRDSIGRNNLLEDYAYFFESYLKGTGGNYYLENPHITFSGLSPLTIDFPGLEGFAAHMLAGLRQAGPVMRNTLGTPLPIAPLEIPYAKIFDIVAKGATSVEALRENCENALDPDKKAAFQVMLERLGWSYAVRGRLVDDTGSPISGAGVRNITKVEEEVFVGGTTNLESKANGEFALVGDVFGGSSILEVTLVDGNPVEVPIHVDWSETTDSYIDLGDVVVAETDNLTINASHEYSHPEAFPPGFQLTLTTDISVEVLGGDAGAVRYEKSIFGDYNSTRLIVKIFAPAGSQLAISGNMSIIPNQTGGTYGDSPHNQITWALSGYGSDVYPSEIFSAVSNSSATVNTTVEINSTGPRAQFYTLSYAEFRTPSNGYLGRFDGWLMVSVEGE